MQRRDKSSRSHRVLFVSVPSPSSRPSLAFILSRGTRDGGTAAPPMLCKSLSVCMASLFRFVPARRLSYAFSCLRPPLRAIPFPSVQSSAVVTSFVREEANVIYEQSRRRHSSRRPRRRRHTRRFSRARRGLRRIPIAIPSVPIKLLFSAGALGMRR